jgi:hypothetical protein
MSAKQGLVAPNMSLREKEWIQQYDLLKHKILQFRQLGIFCCCETQSQHQLLFSAMTGNPLQQNDIKDLNSNLEFLIKGIKLMQNAPMEYEMYGYTSLMCILIKL